MKFFLHKSLYRRVVFIEAMTFLMLFLLLWIDELIDLPYLWLGAPQTPFNWRESLLESLFVLILGAMVLFYTGHLLGKVKRLEGILPICAACKKIRDEKGDWQQIEAFIRDRSQAEFSHSICPDCKNKLYPRFRQHDGEDEAEIS